jgi:hypothetical protein
MSGCKMLRETQVTVCMLFGKLPLADETLLAALQDVQAA